MSLRYENSSTSCPVFTTWLALFYVTVSPSEGSRRDEPAKKTDLAVHKAHNGRQGDHADYLVATWTDRPECKGVAITKEKSFGQIAEASLVHRKDLHC